MCPDPPAALEALAAGAQPMRSVAELAAALDLNPFAAILEIERLEAAGLAAWWDLPDGRRFATLTPLGAARIARRLAEYGPEERPRWIRPDRPDPRTTQAPNPAETGRPPRRPWTETL